MKTFLALHSWELFTTGTVLVVLLFGAVIGAAITAEIKNRRIDRLVETNRRRWKYIKFIQGVHWHAWFYMKPAQREILQKEREQLALSHFGEPEHEGVQP
jgi:energy-converting hydrogenase Eha subunit G